MNNRFGEEFLQKSSKNRCAVLCCSFIKYLRKYFYRNIVFYFDFILLVGCLVLRGNGWVYCKNYGRKHASFRVEAFCLSLDSFLKFGGEVQPMCGFVTQAVFHCPSCPPIHTLQNPLHNTGGVLIAFF